MTASTSMPHAERDASDDAGRIASLHAGWGASQHAGRDASRYPVRVALATTSADTTPSLRRSVRAWARSRS